MELTVFNIELNEKKIIKNHIISMRLPIYNYYLRSFRRSILCLCSLDELSSLPNETEKLISFQTIFQSLSQKGRMLASVLT